VVADNVARPTPWGLIFAPIEERYPELGAISADPAAFNRSPEAQRLLSAIESPELLGTSPIAAAEYLHLLFADWQHWRSGRKCHGVTGEVLETALSFSAPPPPSAPPREPLYLQMPPRALWMQPDPGGAHEPLDGCYVIPIGRDELLIVAILGLHAGRAGLAQVTLTARIEDLATARDALPDDAYAPAMAGGEAAGIRSVRTAAELLHLVRVALGAGAS